MERFLRSGGSPFMFLILMVLLIFFLSACAGMTAKKDASPSEKYLATLTEFNEIWEDYLDQYDLQTPAVKADWKAKIDPWFRRANVSLKAWATAISDGLSPAEKIREFEKYKAFAMAELIAAGIIGINEGK